VNSRNFRCIVDQALPTLGAFCMAQLVASQQPVIRIDISHWLFIEKRCRCRHSVVSNWTLLMKMELLSWKAVLRETSINI